MKNRLQQWLAWLRRDGSRRVVALIVLAVGTAMLVVEDAQIAGPRLETGMVAERDVRAPVGFRYVDDAATEHQRAEAEAAVLPVYDLDSTLASRVRARLSSAFETAGQRHAEAQAAARAAGRDRPSAEDEQQIARDFLRVLELSLDPELVQAIMATQWDREIARIAGELVDLALSGSVVADSRSLPNPPRPLAVQRLLTDTRDEITVEDYGPIKTAEEARQLLGMVALERAGEYGDPERTRVALALARAAVRPNLIYNERLTLERRHRASAAVPVTEVNVQQGTVIVRAGDVVEARHVAMLSALAAQQGDFGALDARLAMAALAVLIFMSLYLFGASYVARFSTRPQDIETAAFLVVLVLSLSRLVVWIGDPAAEALGRGLAPESLWLLAPVAGGAMLIRVLVNSETALLFVLPTAVLCGVMMDQDALFGLYFGITGVAAVAGISQTRERAQVLGAGVQTGLVGAMAALLLHLARPHLGGDDAPTTVRALWDAGFGFLGGLGSSFMVLALVPVFEQFGYLTDYKLLELANLNHPLLRQLMLRAPGTYHHSIIVATLSEAAAEAIQGNALLTRVCCYFHDIGKAVKPHYFIENQRDAPNRHNRLDPRVSARIIINHVLDGGAIARQYKLPKPVVDNVYMHHGTGLIQYFYAKAIERAQPGEAPDERDFRYPGPRPDTREAGIIMLADKVEAASRTVKDPNPDNLREMIQKLVNSTIEDGQFEECPLTLKEIYTVIDTFTHTLLGIYHQRIEYPGLPRHRVSGKPGETRSAVITLEVPGPLTRPGLTDPGPDEEDLDHEPLEAAEKA